MQVQEQQFGAVTVVKPVGALTGEDADAFRSRTELAMSRAMGRVLIDASAIPYADSRGLEVLVELSDAFSAGGQVLRLCGATETLREALDLTDLSGLFEHYEDVHTGTRSFL